MKTFCRAFVSTAMLLVGTAAGAEPYPDRPVRMIVPIGTGGLADATARLLAQKLSDRLGKQFYIENQVGAGGNIGMANAAKAAPDGYTLLFAVSTLMVNPSLFANVPYDPIRDFAPISLVGVSPFVLLVNPAVPARNAEELIATIKASPGKYNFASPGVGTTPHLLGEMLRQSFNLDLVHVPFTSASAAITSTVAGHTHIYFTAPSGAAPLVKEGALRAIAITSRTRSALLPDVPTVMEAGLPGEGADTIVGVLAPTGTPEEIIERLHREIVQIAASPDVKERFATYGLEPVVNTPDEFAAEIKSQIGRWAKVIRDTKIRSE